MTDPRLENYSERRFALSRAILIFYCEKSDGWCVPGVPLSVLSSGVEPGYQRRDEQRGRETGDPREAYTGHYKALQRVLLTSVSNPRAARK